MILLKPMSPQDTGKRKENMDLGQFSGNNVAGPIKIVSIL
jgi:hypothetical protein